MKFVDIFNFIKLSFHFIEPFRNSQFLQSSAIKQGERSLYCQSGIMMCPNAVGPEDLAQTLPSVVVNNVSYAMFSVFYNKNTRRLEYEYFG